MPKLFISYRRSDSRAVSGRIYKDLARAIGKRNIFKDVDNMPLGRDFRGVIREATAECQVMLVVIGRGWLNATDDQGRRRLDDPEDFVRIEVETGLKRDGVTVIPLLVDGAPMPRPDDLPLPLRELTFNHAFTLHDDPLFDRDIETLIRLLRPLVGRTNRFAGIAAALLVLLLIGGALLLNQLNNGGTASTLESSPAAATRDTSGLVSDPTNTPTLTSEPTAMDSTTPEPTFTSTPTDSAIPEPTFTPTPTDSATPEPTSTPTEAPTALPVALIVATLDTEATIQQATLDVEATAAARATEYAFATQRVIDATATATLWTHTPTPNMTASIAAYRREQAATVTQAWIDSWTPTFTPSYTPSATYTATLTSTHTLSPTYTVTVTPTRTSIPTLTLLESALERARMPVTANARWTPFAHDFGDGVSMMLVPTGCFEMGNDSQAQYWDGSQWITGVSSGGRQCFTAPFWIDRDEVTNAQYERFIDAGGYTNRAYWTEVGWSRRTNTTQPGCWTDSRHNSADQPVVCISWYEAVAYANWRAEQTGLPMRLPTEAEWEYAARGPDALIYPWGNEWVVANTITRGTNPDSIPQTAAAAVGSRPSGASWVGAFDLSSNVWEWTSSVLVSYPYQVADGREAENSIDARVLRGGVWDNLMRLVRSASRHGHNPLNTSTGYGFRLVGAAPS